MQHPFAKLGHSDVRRKLVDLLEAARGDWNETLTDDTSLIKSGYLDSLALFNLAIFIEHQIGRPIDPSRLDLPDEWDTVKNIMAFIRTQWHSA